MRFSTSPTFFWKKTKRSMFWIRGVRRATLHRAEKNIQQRLKPAKALRLCRPPRKMKWKAQKLRSRAAAIRKRKGMARANGVAAVAAVAGGIFLSEWSANSAP